MPSSDELKATIRQRSIAERLKPHLAAEDYFNRTGRTFRKSKRRLWFNRHIKPRVLRFGFTLLGIYGRGEKNALRPELHRLTLAFPDLPPALDGFELLQISDLHIDELPALADALVPLLKPLRPNLCVLTGDYRWEITGPCDRIYPPLYKVLDSVTAQHGCVGILGNHDAAEIAVNLETHGVRMLINESIPVQHEGATLWVAGTDDPFDYRCDDLPAALSGIPANAFTVLLTHSPQLYEEAAERGVQLYLCGHTHAGQIRLPFLGAVKKNAPVDRKFVQGHWQHRSMHGYTSWGAGCSTLPIRLNCPPEVTLIRLVRAV